MTNLANVDSLAHCVESKRAAYNLATGSERSEGSVIDHMEAGATEQDLLAPLPEPSQTPWLILIAIGGLVASSFINAIVLLAG